MNLLVCIAKEEPYIDHWLDWHLTRGFDRALVFTNDWNYKSNSEFVEVISKPGKVQQLEAYNMVVHARRFDWALFADVDEYLCCPGGLREFLRLQCPYENIGVPWRMMGSCDSGGDNPVDRFRHWDWDPNLHVKSLVSAIHPGRFINPHRTNRPTVTPEGKVIQLSFGEPSDLIWINHYYYQDMDHWHHKVTRGRADSIKPSHQRTMGEWNEGINFCKYEFDPKSV